jgi:hypothetical protein
MKRKRIRARIIHDDDTSTTPPRPSGPTPLDCIADPALFAPWFKDERTWI